MGVPAAYSTVFYDAEVEISSYSSTLTNKEEKRATFRYSPSATEPWERALKRPLKEEAGNTDYGIMHKSVFPGVWMSYGNTQRRGVSGSLDALWKHHVDVYVRVVFPGVWIPYGNTHVVHMHAGCSVRLKKHGNTDVWLFKFRFAVYPPLSTPSHTVRCRRGGAAAAVRCAEKDAPATV